MNVNCEDSDIDTVCFCPNFVNREEDFIKDLYNILFKTENISDLYAISDASVPLIKMKYFNIQVDISLAKFNFESFENMDFDFLSNKILNFVDDEKSLKSLNGIRNCEMILASVNNHKHFRTTLKFIKVWAKNMGIYSSLMGYLGGISWSILVAKICQLYPKYCPNKLIERLISC